MPPTPAANNTAMHAAISIQLLPGLRSVEVVSGEDKTDSPTVTESAWLTLRLAPPERLPKVLRTVAGDGSTADGVASVVSSGATDPENLSTCKFAEGINGGAWTGGATGSSTTLFVLDFTWAAGLVTTSKCGLTEVAGFPVIVVAAGCTSSCEPIEINGAVGFGASLIGDVTAGDFATGENDSDSDAFCASDSGAGAGAHEVSNGGATANFLIGVGVSTATGDTGLFAGVGPSEGK